MYGCNNKNEGSTFYSSAFSLNKISMHTLRHAITSSMDNLKSQPTQRIDQFNFEVITLKNLMRIKNNEHTKFLI